MIILSKGYFKSKNCMREVQACYEGRKLLVLLHETDEAKGGAPLDVLRSECSVDVRDYVFGSERTIIPWHRISVFQLVSLKLVVEGMLSGCPEYAGKPSPELYLPNELPRVRLAFRSPPRVYVSEHNPRAAEVARVLRAGMEESFEITTEPEDLPKPRSTFRLRRSVAALRRTSAMRRSSQNANPSRATHFLLYLSEDTFVGESGELLAAEVRNVRSAALPIVMVHENDPEHRGCAFGQFFNTTPQDLIDGGLYSDIAVAMFRGAFQSTSIAQVAMKLGAASGRLRWRSGFFTTAGAAAAATAAVVAPQKPPVVAPEEPPPPPEEECSTSEDALLQLRVDECEGAERAAQAVDRGGREDPRTERQPGVDIGVDVAAREVASCASCGVEQHRPRPQHRGLRRSRPARGATDAGRDRWAQRAPRVD